MIIISSTHEKGLSSKFQVPSQSISSIGIASIACDFFVVAVLSVVVAINCSRSSAFCNGFGAPTVYLHPLYYVGG
jgi:hypothetical protein